MSNRSNNLAEQRICRLLDENSFMEIGSLVTARNTDFNLADEATPSCFGTCRQPARMSQGIMHFCYYLIIDDR